MLKFIGAVFIVAAGSFMGELETAKLRKREKQLTELLELVGCIELYLSAYSLSTEELFSFLASKHGDYYSCFETSGSDLTSEVSQKIRASSLEMKDELADHIAEFGRTTLDGQLKKTSMLRCIVSDALHSAGDIREKNTRLYKAAGFSFGLLTAMLLI